MERFSVSDTAGDRALFSRRGIHDPAAEQKFLNRAADWRNGAIVYQIIVDRFVPPKNLEKKRGLYPEHSEFKKWTDLPVKGHFNPKAGVWSHELDFWGGDLQSLESRLDYIKGLQVDVIYLNPLFLSLTNHKYDAWDYRTVDPVYGSNEDLRKLCRKIHHSGMKLVLDGVFNHMGVKSPFFQEAVNNPASPNREFFKFTPDSQTGYIGWMDVENLPELNLENIQVRDYLYLRKDSVIQSYLTNENIDGWRLDVAFDLGFHFLNELTLAAHRAKPGSLIVGEIYNYPEEWFPSVDGVMNMHGRSIIYHLIQGHVSGPVASAMWETMIHDSGIDNILKSWLVLDNHDNGRLASVFSAESDQKMARVLQFSLPGSPCLYYGSEAGMKGTDDPEQRGPMDWDRANPDNPVFSFHKELLAIRKNEPALAYGDYRKIHTEKLFAFIRRTESVTETIVVIANPSSEDVHEFLQVPESKFQDMTVLKDLLSDARFTVSAGTVNVFVQAGEVLLLKADIRSFQNGYDRYKRVR